MPSNRLLTGPAVITLIYALLAFLWILLSDRLLAMLVSDTEMLVELSTVKGWVFVALTSAVLYGLVQRLVSNLDAAHAALSEEQSAKIEALKLLEVVSDSALDAIFVKDRAGRFLVCNRHIQQLLGADREHILGRDASDFLPEAEAKALMLQESGLMARAETVTIKESITTVSGKRIFQTTKGPVFDGRQKLIGMFGISRDITEEEFAARELKNREQLLREVQQVAQLGYYVYDMVSDRWESSEILDQLFGIGPSYVRDRDGWLALVAPEMRAEMADYLMNLMLSGDYFNREYPILRAADGVTRWMAGIGRIERDEDGHPLRMVGTIQDITSRVEVDRAMRHKTEQLLQSNRDLEQFASVASHDLQTPLRNIVHYTQLIERRYKATMDDEGQEFVGFVVDGAKRMTRLISDLLEYSRISSQGKPLLPVPVGDCLAQALNNLALVIEASQAEIDAGELPTVLAEPPLLTSLLQNLIENGVKYRAADRAPRLCLRAERQDVEWWRFSLSDNGIGIEPQYLEKVFEMFQRLNPGIDTQGTGIGLTLCRRIIHRFGGAIWITSIPGQGTTLYFTLRAAI